MSDRIDLGPNGSDVSRETMERLQHFEQLLKKWNKSINLVSASTIDDIWNRHILDSAQIVRLAPETTASWVDLGSGGGLPGIVVATILSETSPSTEVTLIEADIRKSTFLRSAIRELGLATKVISERIEEARPMSAKIVSARALAPLRPLLGYVERHISSDGIALLQKGQNAAAEIQDAQTDWIFDCTSHTSITNNSASILEIKGLKRA